MTALLLALALLPAAHGRAAVPESILALHQDFIEASDLARKEKIIERIAQTAPASPNDVQKLFDLFSRYPSPGVRQSVMSAVGHITPAQKELESVFLAYLEEEEPEEQIFGVNGALALRSEKALPLVEKIAKRKFQSPDPADLVLLSERNAWWLQFEALSALAKWRGAAVLPLLKRRAAKAPKVAGIMAAFLWKDSLDTLLDWHAAGGKKRARALEGLKADVAAEDLRPTRERLLKAVRDPKADPELRRFLALKAGAASSADEAVALVGEHGSCSDEALKGHLAAAAMASRSPAAAPLALRQAREHSDPLARAEALAWLSEEAADGQYREVLEWAARAEPDADNRAEAARLLAVLKASSAPKDRENARD